MSCHLGRLGLNAGNEMSEALAVHMDVSGDHIYHELGNSYGWNPKPRSDLEFCLKVS